MSFFQRNATHSLRITAALKAEELAQKGGPGSGRYAKGSHQENSASHRAEADLHTVAASNTSHPEDKRDAHRLAAKLHDTAAMAHSMAERLAAGDQAHEVSRAAWAAGSRAHGMQSRLAA